MWMFKLKGMPVSRAALRMAWCAAEGLEEALRASLEDEGAAGPPPASKSAVKALVKERLTPERLAQLGGEDVQCSVCRCVTLVLDLT